MLYGQDLYVILVVFFIVTTQVDTAVPNLSTNHPPSFTFPNIYSSPRSVMYCFFVPCPFNVGCSLPSVFPSILCCVSCTYSPSKCCIAHAPSRSISSIHFIQRKAAFIHSVSRLLNEPREYCKQQYCSVSTIHTSRRGGKGESYPGSCVPPILFAHAHLWHARRTDQMSSVSARV
jgi:hypothetical protein